MVRAKERRRRQRIDVALSMKVEYNKEKITTQSKNISILGTYIETNKEIPLGVSLDIKIRIPKVKMFLESKSKQLKCTGVAFRSEPVGLAQQGRRYGTGIFFRSFEKNGERDLSRYIDCILKQEKKIGKIYMRRRKRKS